MSDFVGFHNALDVSKRALRVRSVPVRLTPGQSSGHHMASVMEGDDAVHRAWEKAAKVGPSMTGHSPYILAPPAFPEQSSTTA